MLQLCYNGFAWPKDHVMITVNAKVFEHHQKEDGTWNVKICVYHQGVRRYVETTHFVSRKQLDAKFKIKVSITQVTGPAKTVKLGQPLR